MKLSDGQANPSAEVQGRKPLSPDEVAYLKNVYGYNVIKSRKRKSCTLIFFGALLHPFNILLCLLAIAAVCTEDYITAVIMSVMISLSAGIRFYQELKSYRAAQSLLTLLCNKVTVIRHTECDKLSPLEEIEIDTEELVPGDWVKLEPGNVIPADMVLVESTELYVSQASLTGEAIPVEKFVVNRKEEETVINVTPGMEPLGIQQRSTVQNGGKPFKKKLKRWARNIIGLHTNLETDVDSEETRLKMKENLEKPDMCYMGTAVVTGTATAIVNNTGQRTFFGLMAEQLSQSAQQTAFQLGVRRISWIFFLTMFCLVPPVLLIIGIGRHDWRGGIELAVAVAVGLTPEMLPMIVTTCLAKGAYQLAIRKCVVKSLDAVVNLGGMDILCTDKTGTLTQSVVTLDRYIDPAGQTSHLTLLLTYLNSYFQSVQKSPMDVAVLLYYDTFNFQGAKTILDANMISFGSNGMFGLSKVAEIPFDFNRRRTSVVLKEKDVTFLICKGAAEEILSVCTKTLSQVSNLSPESCLPPDSCVSSMTDAALDSLREMNINFSELGLRVLGVAYKKLNGGTTTQHYDTSFEEELTFVGYVAFVDPPKVSAAAAIKDLIKNNVKVKVLTGDSSVVCQRVCKEIELPVESIITSVDLEDLNDTQMSELAERGTIFSKLTPIQKADIVRALRRNGHIIGFLGDGINDAAALSVADVGISVDSGADIAKESADIILLEKDLGVVGQGVIIGRSTFGNTLKYIVMAVSSNFGNVFSVTVATLWLPFEPMLALHLLVQNLLYDISQIAIPWDHMDPEFLAVPHRWSMTSVLKFMAFIGPWSSVFDISTFAFMYFYYDIKKTTDDTTLFQTTWFVVGLSTQTLVVHMIRTPKIPFLQSWASFPVIASTFVIMGLGAGIPSIPWLNDHLHMKELPKEIYLFVVVVLICYATAAQLAKILYIRLFKKWF